MLTINTLGGLAVTCEGAPVTDLVTRKAEALLVYLACTGRTHARELLAEMFWAERTPERALGNLRVALTSLRKQVGDYLLIARDAISMQPGASVWLDAAQLEEKLRAGQLEKAVALYTGDFLAGFYVRDCPGFEDWLTLERERLRRLVLDALRDLVDHHLEVGDYRAGIAQAARLLELDPLLEEAHRQLMRLLAYDGQRGAAMAQYEACRRLLEDELGVEPEEETVRLFEQIQAGELERPTPRAPQQAEARTPAGARTPATLLSSRGYELRECVGVGAHYEVYRAYQPAVGRDVAVKVIMPQHAQSPEFVQRFETEARLVARLEHAHIVPLYDYWQGPGGVYLVMRWLGGGSLYQALQRGPWHLEPAARLLEEIAGALDYAHHHGVVHRDVKPHNIVLDEQGRAYLADFGIAKDLMRRFGETGDLSGTLPYRSPERMQGQPATPQGDQYSLGVVMYEVLSGEYPFDSANPVLLFHEVMTKPPPPLGERRPDLPVALDAVLQRATAKDPALRFPDVAAFAAAFRQAAAQVPPEAGLPEKPLGEPTLRLPAFLESEAAVAGASEDAGAPIFVARERELARLDCFLQAALAGQGRVVFVTGGPGRGKTALLAQFARRAMAAHPDLLVATGNCNAYSGVGDPYLPIREVMAMLTGDVEARWAAGAIRREHAQRLWTALPWVIQALLDHGPHVIGALVRGRPLVSRATAAAAEGDVWLERLRERVERERSRSEGLEQSHLFQQVTNLLHALSEAHPLLLVLDDLQWVDTASVGLLFHLGRRLAGNRILVAGAYRPEEIALGREGERHPLEQVLAEFKRAFGDVWLDLAELPEPEGRHFVDAFLETEPNRLGEDFRRALFEHTGGHPLFTVELLRAMQERGDLVRNAAGRWVEGDALDWDTLPARVEAVIEERIARLEEVLRDILTVASVEGEVFTAQVVGRIQGIGERKMLQTLSRQLEQSYRLVRGQGEEQVGRQRLSRYRFAHALFQQYLYNDLSLGECRLLHEEIATVLEELYAGHTEAIAVQLARHYGEAGDDARALKYGTLAGDAALASYANREAVAHFRRALELAPAEAERAHLLAGLGEALHRLGQLDKALQALREGIGLYQALGNLDGVAGLYSRLARVTWWTGDHAGALRLCEEGLEAVAGAPESREQAQLLHEAARAIHFAFLPEKARALCQRALEMAGRLGAVDVEIDALATLGMLCDTPQEGLKALERAAELAEEAEFLDLAGRAHTNLSALWANLQGDSRTARQHTMRVLALDQQTGDIPGELFTRTNAIGDAALMGDLEEAAAHLLRMRHLAAELADPGEASWMIVDGEATIQWYRGDWANAARLVRERLPEAHRLGDLQNEAGCGCQLADALLEAHFAARESDIHELLEAERALTRVLEIMEAWSDSLRFAECHCLLSALFASQGRLEEAHSHLEEARRRARNRPQTRFEAAVLWAEGRLALAEARWPEAQAAFKAMVGLNDRLGLRWEVARGLIDWAEALTAGGEPAARQRAEDLLRQSQSAFGEMGAPRYVALVQDRLAELGAAPQ